MKGMIYSYDIVTLESWSLEPKRENKITFVNETPQDRNKFSSDEYADHEEFRRSNNYSQFLSNRNIENLSTSHSENRDDEKNKFNIRLANKSKNEMYDKAKVFFDRKQRDRNRRLRDRAIDVNKYYDNIPNLYNNNLSRQNPLSKSYNTIDIQKNKSFL